MRFFSFLLFFFSATINSYGQTEITPNPPLGLAFYTKMESLYSTPDSMFYCAEKAFYHLQQSKYKEKAAKSVLHMAIAKFWLGEQLKSKKYGEQAVQYCIKNIGKQNETYNSSLNILAFYYQDIGDYENAQKMYVESISCYKKGKVKKNYLAAYYLNLGILHSHFEEFGKSIACYKNAYRLFSETKESLPNQFANVHINMGNAFLLSKDYHQAKNNFLKGYNFIKNSTEKYDAQIKLMALQGLGKIYLKNNQLDSTHYCLQQLENIRQTYGNQFQYSYDGYIVGAELYANLGELDKAENAYNEAITIAQDWFKDFKKNDEVAKMQLKKAAFFYEYKSLEAALNFYQTALIENSPDFEEEDWTKNPTHSQFLNPSYGLQIWTGKAQVLYDLYQKTNDIKYLETAMEVCDLTTQLIFHIRKTFQAAQAKLYLSERVVPFYELAILIALELKEQNQNIAYADKAFQFAEANKSLLLLESMAKNKAIQAVDLDSSLVYQEIELEQEMAFYNKKIAEAKQRKRNATDTVTTQKNAAQITAWEANLFDLKETHSILLDSLEVLYPKIYAQNQMINNLNLAELQQNRLSSDMAAIEFFVGKKHVFAFLIHQNGIEILKNNQLETLKKSVQNINHILNFPPESQVFQTDFETFTKESQAIYQQLLQALVSKLPAQINQLTIIPDGFLSFMPFEILLTEPPIKNTANYGLSNMAYLLEKYTINYQYSANLLTAIDERLGQKDSLIFAGFAPVFSSSTIASSRDCVQDDLYSLHCNQGEIQEIQSIVNGQTYLALDANKTTFLDKITESDILHLATHVCMDTENPQNSKIFFTNGYLTAYDLVGLQLDKDLTVLSACNTGTGKLSEGEGVLSLAREFTLAGSRSTLTSFWTVDDCSTSKIMTAYYAQLKEGKRKDDALRIAKIIFLKTADKEIAHPYYWAAFLQFGDVTALYTTPFAWKNAYIFWILGTLSLICGGSWLKKNRTHYF